MSELPSPNRSYIVWIPPDGVTSTGEVDPMELVTQENVPRIYASIDGKPSDQYDSEQSYVTGTVIAVDPGAFHSVSDRMTEMLGARLVKPATYRRKRRLQYLKKVLRALATLQDSIPNFPLRLMVSRADESALDPLPVIHGFRQHPLAWSYYGLEAINETHIVFVDREQMIHVPFSHFGGMVHWVRMAAAIDFVFTTKYGRPVHWMLCADKLPGSQDGERMRVFARFLHECVGRRIWLSFAHKPAENDEYCTDVLTDIFVSAAYECIHPNGAHDKDLERVFLKCLGKDRGTLQRAGKW